MKYQKLIAVALVTTMLAACNPPPQGAGNQTLGASKQDIGTLLGGIGGGIIGSNVGKGKGKTVATIAGALLGGLAGNSIGGSLDKADAAYLGNTTNQALETAPAGQAMPWSNPQSGNYGTVIPQAPYKVAGGGYCREFQQKIVVGGKTQSGYGKACRQPDGSWQIVE
jgi:surface antigen